MIDAMKQALEALEWGQPIIEDYGSKEQLQAHISAKDALYKAIEQADKQEPKRDKPLRLSPMYEYGHIHDAELPWVGLTDEEIKDILDCGRGGLVDIKKAEQILREKNT